MKSNRIASIIIESNRELGESFQAYSPALSGHAHAAFACSLTIFNY